MVYSVLALGIHFSTVICPASKAPAGLQPGLWSNIGWIFFANPLAPSSRLRTEGCVVQVLEQPLEHYVHCLSRSHVVIVLDPFSLPLMTCNQVTPQNPRQNSTKGPSKKPQQRLQHRGLTAHPGSTSACVSSCSLAGDDGDFFRVQAPLNDLME